jgi:hypothetical protein
MEPGGKTYNGGIFCVLKILSEQNHIKDYEQHNYIIFHRLIFVTCSNGKEAGIA